MTPRFFSSKWSTSKNVSKPLETSRASKAVLNPLLKQLNYNFASPLLDKTVEFTVAPDENFHDILIPSEYIYAIKATKDGKILTVGEDECLKIFELNQDGIWSCTHSIPGYRHGILTLEVFDNGKILLGGNNGTVYIIEKNAKNVWCHSLKNERYQYAITALAIVNNDKFFTASPDAPIICWQRKAEGIWAHDLVSTALRINSLLAFKNEIVAGTSSGQLHFFSLNKENKWQRKLSYELVNNQSINALTSISDDKLGAVSEYGKIFIIKYSSEKGFQYLKTFNVSYEGSAGLVKLSNNLIASYGYNSAGYHLWDLKSKEKWPTPIKVKGESIRSLEILPNGKIVTLSGNNKLQIISFAKYENQLNTELEMPSLSLGR